MIRPGAGRSLAPWAEDRRPSLEGAGGGRVDEGPLLRLPLSGQPSSPRELLGTQSSGNCVSLARDLPGGSGPGALGRSRCGGSPGAPHGSLPTWFWAPRGP